MNYLSFDVGIKNLSYCELNQEKQIIQWDIINIDDSPICDVTLRKKCEKQATYSINNNETIKYCCTTHSKKFKGKKKLNTKNDIFKLSQLCISKLNMIDLSRIRTVLIENQPALKNPIMKSIQMIIYTFFIIKGVMDPKSGIENVNMVNARNKLKIYKGPKINCNKKGKYAQNKFLSIEYTKYMINNEDIKFKDLFHTCKKKDDLADSYLQGIYWIEKYN